MNECDWYETAVPAETCGMVVTRLRWQSPSHVHRIERGPCGRNAVAQVATGEGVRSLQGRCCEHVLIDERCWWWTDGRRIEASTVEAELALAALGLERPGTRP